MSYMIFVHFKQEPIVHNENDRLFLKKIIPKENIFLLGDGHSSHSFIKNYDKKTNKFVLDKSIAKVLKEYCKNNNRYFSIVVNYATDSILDAYQYNRKMKIKIGELVDGKKLEEAVKYTIECD